MPERQTSDNTVRACLLFISAVLVVYSFHVLRDILAPLAMAIFIWLIIDAFARWIDEMASWIPYWLGLTLALITVVLGLVGVALIITDTGFNIARDAPRYSARIQEITGWIADVSGREISYEELDREFAVTRRLQSGLLGLAGSVQSVLSDFLVIGVYVAFLFAAQSSFAGKMDDLFPDSEGRRRASHVTGRIRESVEKYLGVQTVASLIQTVLSYIVMVGFGLENALFWAMVIFILNYIPIIGGIFAVVLPVLFALVQFDSLRVFAVFTIALTLVQAVFNNFVQPRMMGDSMNMSALVVILSLTLWGALWGGVGMFLSAPLTVITMIILAQFPATRWISVLLSVDGYPDDEKNPDNDKKNIMPPS
ncbi:MAG: AI-2E family transporter [Hyphomonadaceae bacterium]|nr:AI-2E family transporter [Hyphomonadaceae bacterium]